MKGRRIAVATVLAAAVALVAAAGVSAADGRPGPMWGSQVASPAAAADTEGNLQFWGYTPGQGDWHSEVQRSTGSADHSPESFRGLKIAVPPAGATKSQGTKVSDAASTPDAAALGFLCSLFVGDAYLSADGVKAYTAATCSGLFDVQYTGAQFKRSSWLGWQNFSGVMTTPTTTYYENDYNFWRYCNLSGGTYNYRLFAVQHTMADDGTWHSGPTVYSADDFRYHCGT